MQLHTDSWTTVEDSQENSETEAEDCRRNEAHLTETDNSSDDDNDKSSTNSESDTTANDDEDSEGTSQHRTISENKDEHTTTQEDDENADTTSTGTYVPDPEWKGQSKNTNGNQSSYRDKAALIARRGGRQWIKMPPEADIDRHQDEGGTNGEQPMNHAREDEGINDEVAGDAEVGRIVTGVEDVAEASQKGEYGMGGEEKGGRDQKRGTKRKVTRKCNNCGSEVSV